MNSEPRGSASPEKGGDAEDKEKNTCSKDSGGNRSSINTGSGACGSSGINQPKLDGLDVIQLLKIKEDLEKEKKSDVGSVERSLKEIRQSVVEQQLTSFVDETTEGMLSDLEKEPWFHGALPMEDISSLVQHKGDFLLRTLDGDHERAAMACLTVRWDTLRDHPVHILYQDNVRYYTINGIMKSTSIIDLIQMHRRQNIAVSEDIILGKPIPKQPWELSKEKITMEMKLGEGAFGEVWKGKMQHSGNSTVDVAIKVTKVNDDNKSKMDEMYREARLMRQYKHRNVVAFYGMVIDNDNVMIIMEMVRGGGLDHHLKKNPDISVSDRCGFTFDVALGLYYLHSKRCIHRDLACRNCLIDIDQKIVKISDFGLSKQADSYKIPPTEMTPIRWQAPEVISTAIYTRECDVYSYGILVWEIFNNAKLPFDGIDNKTIKARLSDPNFRPPIAQTLPVEIRVILEACWNAIPQKRPHMKDITFILSKHNKHQSSVTIPNKKSVGSVVTPSKKPIQSVRKSTISEQSVKHKTKPHSKKSSTHMKIKSMSSVKDTRKKSAVVPKNKTPDPSREKSCANKRRH